MAVRTEWVKVEVKVETVMAIGVENLKGETVWIPRSQIIDEDEREGKFLTLELPMWLLTEKDLV